MSKRLIPRFFATVALLCGTASALAQQVCLPAPRLLTVMPMGGQAGTKVEARRFRGQARRFRGQAT